MKPAQATPGEPGNPAPKGRGRGTKGISQKSRLAVWVRCGGRCCFPGCNAPLLGDELSGTKRLNKALIAHVVAASPDGPRGDPVRSRLLVDDPENLMLLCHGHHHLVDDERPDDYPEHVLQAMKAEHEARIAMLTGIQPERATHALLYGARIGEHDTPLREGLAFAAILPERYPRDGRAIALGLGSCSHTDSEQAYWDFQVEHLRRTFAQRVEERRISGEIDHLSAFALAPQPLLMELGRLLGDQGAVEVFQLGREQQAWRWRETGDAIEYTVRRPPEARSVKTVALKLALSATMADSRVEAALGIQVPIWEIACTAPGTDVLSRSACLSRFRGLVRKAFDDIKAAHGEGAEIHVFPALPVSAAVEVGRVWMPKSDLPLVVYDNDRATGGFKRRHRLGN